jgi:prophage antirepressor-like protein
MSRTTSQTWCPQCESESEMYSAIIQSKTKVATNFSNPVSALAEVEMHGE